MAFKRKNKTTKVDEPVVKAVETVETVEAVEDDFSFSTSGFSTLTYVNSGSTLDVASVSGLLNHGSPIQTYPLTLSLEMSASQTSVITISPSSVSNPGGNTLGITDFTASTIGAGTSAVTFTLAVTPNHLSQTDYITTGTIIASLSDNVTGDEDFQSSVFTLSGSGSNQRWRGTMIGEGII